MSCYRILRDDGGSDAITGRLYASYDAAHQELERYYADLCCSDDRTYYRIVEPKGEQPGDPIAEAIAEPRLKPFAEDSEPTATAGTLSR